jgi:excisionase family DNA binding protein
VSDAAKPLPLMLTIEQLAEAAQIPRATMYEHVKRGNVPGVRKIGRHLRVHRDTVLAWLAGGSPGSRSRGPNGR